MARAARTAGAAGAAGAAEAAWGDVRRRPALWAAAVAVVALHLWGLYAPETPPVPDALALPGLDKVAHVLLFALPAFVLPFVVRPAWVVPVLLVVHAPASEWAQGSLLARRTGDLLDVAADLTGVGLGWLAYRWVRTRPGRLSSPAS